MTIASPACESAERNVPLAVDLDGTLIASDSLAESALLLIKQKPWYVFRLLWWLLAGRTKLKSEIGKRVQLGCDTLPYRQEIVGYLEAQHAAGRKLILATAAHRTVADGVAEHLRLFDEVLASDERTNQKGATKRDELIKRFGVRGFDYIGDSRADLPVWAASRMAHVAGFNPNIAALAQAVGAERGRAFVTARPGVRTWLRAIRVQQWVKNTLIFVPLILAHRLEAHAVARELAAFFGFSFLASSTYIVNDLFDLGADRKHPVKRNRAFASGELSISQGIFVALGLLLASLAFGALLGAKTLGCLLIYFAVALLYSWFLKQEPILDVVVLAFLYTLRLITGGVAASVHISMWLFQFSLFLFVSLALVKRYSELHRMKSERAGEGRARGYHLGDLTTISQTGIASGLLAGLVLALYVNGPDVQRLYAWPHALWGACPIFIYWITRLWLIAGRGGMHEDCIVFAFHDRVSYLAGLGIVALMLIGIMAHAG
jgi:4-hydroxybenzoate polyprenyltransferase/phosphoglycolate phosphatase-like HAD superfamily hydrolase